MSDRVFGAVLLALAAGFAWQARNFESGLIIGADPLGPKSWPYVLAAACAVTSLGILLRPDRPPHWPGGLHLAQMGLIVAVLCAYAAFLENLGFLLATALASAAISWRLGGRPLAALATGVGVAAVLYFLFDLVLGLPLPAGVLKVG